MVTSLLGQGGMGKVYLGHHPAIERKGAIKVMHPNLAGDPLAVARFFTEARALSAIRHPHIVDIYDCGTLPDGAPYIVMEYLEGETLSARLRRTRLTLAEALDIACQAASAVAAAHDRGIVHRDLKPENIYLVRDPRVPGREVVKVLDFGVAKLQRQVEESPHTTRNGALIGTPLYMSPEQCLGEGEVDVRSDIYSLGVIVYEMLCGRPPFVSEGVGAIINMQINQAPPAPRGLNPAVPAALEDAVLRALAKEPAARFAGMNQFLEALRGIGAGLGPDGAPLLPAAELQTAAQRWTPTPVPLSALETLHMPAAQPFTRRARARWRLSAWRKWVLTVVAVIEAAAGVALFVAMRGRSREAKVETPPAAAEQAAIAAVDGGVKAVAPEEVGGRGTRRPGDSPEGHSPL